MIQIEHFLIALVPSLSTPSWNLVQRILNGTQGDSLTPGKIQEPYVTPEITITSINKRATIICYDTIINSHPNYNPALFLQGLVFKLLDFDTTVYFINSGETDNGFLVCQFVAAKCNCEAFSQTAFIDGSSIFQQKSSFSVPVTTKRRKVLDKCSSEEHYL